MKVSCRADRGRKKGYIHLYIYAVVCCQLIYVVCIFTLFFLYYVCIVFIVSSLAWGNRRKTEIDSKNSDYENTELDTAHTSVYKQTWNHPLIITTNLPQQTRAEKLFIGPEKNKQN